MMKTMLALPFVLASLASLASLVAACGGGGHKSSPDAPGGMASTGLVVAGDYTAGNPGTMAAIDLVAMTATTNAAPQGAVGDDPMVRHFGGETFVVNRSDGNNVTILDANRQLVAQLGTGAGSNPQDVAVMGNKLYVPVFGGTGVAVLTRGSQTIDTIDLSADDPDGHPDCVSAYLVGSDLYVACDLLDPSFMPRGAGKVYVVDTTTGQITHSVTMQTKNPLGIFVQLPSGDLAIPTIDFSDGTGCVEKIQTGASPASAGCMVMNSQLSGYASGLAVQDSGSGGQILWMAVALVPDFMHANLQGFDLGSNQLWSMPITPDTEIIASVAACPGGDVLVTDSTMSASGVRVYRSTTQLTTAPLSAGLRTANANALACY